LILFLGKRWFEKVGRKGKEKRFCTNCSELVFTYIEAEKKYGITKSRFSRAIDDLLAKGFITIKRKGGGYQKDKSVYAISDKWRLWLPNTVIEKRKKEIVQRGFCKPKRGSSTSKIVPMHSHANEAQKKVLQQ
jgi:DNA-binding PadR family transcriptional regulator